MTAFNKEINVGDCMKYQEYEFGQEQLISELVWKVFDKFEAPDYPVEGIKTFKTYIEAEHLKEMVVTSDYKIYCCFAEESLLGVIAFRNQNHISLLFVKEEFHRQGIAKQLFSYALEKLMAEN